MSRPWTRICVDVDVSGKPIATSWEVHDGHQLLSFATGPEPSPFDELSDAFDAVVVEFVARYGWQQQLL